MERRHRRFGGAAITTKNGRAALRSCRPASCGEGERRLDPIFATGSWPQHPELRLMAAVLGDAVGIVLRGWIGRTSRFAEARAWILSDDVMWPFSFLCICDALDLEPERLRREIAPRLSAAHVEADGRRAFLTA